MTLPWDATSPERNTTTTVVALTAPHHGAPWLGWLEPLPNLPSTSTDSPGCRVARTELRFGRTASPATACLHPTLTSRRSRRRAFPPQPKLSHWHESKSQGTGNVWVGSIFPASFPPMSSSSPELAVRRSPVPLSLTVAPRLSGAARGRDGRAGRACVLGRVFSRAGPVTNLIYFISFIRS
jgi:hypothetical protein